MSIITIVGTLTSKVKKAVTEKAKRQDFTRIKYIPNHLQTLKELTNRMEV